MRWVALLKNFLARPRLAAQRAPVLAHPTTDSLCTTRHVSPTSSYRNTLRSSSRCTLRSSASGGSVDSSVLLLPTTSRGRDRRKKENINAARSDRSSPRFCMSPLYVISPTDRSVKMNALCVDTNINQANFLMLKKTQSGVWNCTFPDDTVVIYTDASYMPRTNASGIGIYHGPGHELNRSHRVRGTIQNNNYAEMLAVIVALRDLLAWDGYSGQKVIIRTDNLAVVTAVTKSGGAYPELTEKLLALAEQFPKGVSFQHVYAHEGDPGNEMADTLAGIATSRRSKSAEPRARSRPRSLSRERNRSRSRSNEPEFVRSHSAHVRRCARTPRCMHTTHYTLREKYGRSGIAQLLKHISNVREVVGSSSPEVDQAFHPSGDVEFPIPENGFLPEKIIRKMRFKNVSDVLPPFLPLVGHYKTAPRYNLMACGVMKSMSTIILNTMCLLYNPPGKNYKQVVFVRDPIDRFVSFFVDKCIHKRNHCFGCKGSVRCVAKELFLKLKGYAEGHRQGVTYEEYHAAPISWYCDLGRNLLNYKVIYFPKNRSDHLKPVQEFIDFSVGSTSGTGNFGEDPV
ncbi:unnamed protein product [Caenorhabditis auriculariae]|uniref:RNase H type-1 domain-containing protein n=1 Tax=Caenorhabditis auriculariae TaxID=2777116 RepID=A0A8S1HB19_9PELO|nr:unnamed protein product [Caenorhabditis auriculariae]